jgi:hypothetical protein
MVKHFVVSVTTLFIAKKYNLLLIYYNTFMSVLQFIQMQRMVLAGSGSSIGDTTIILQSMVGIDGANIVTADLGTKAYGTLEPGNGTQEEAISFTGVTQNANGTATLTGVKTCLFKSPYTETSGLAKTHAGASTFILSNDAGFYNNIMTYVNTSLSSGAVPATTSLNGIVTLSTTPASATTPVVVSVSDPRLPTADPTTLFAPLTDIQNFESTGTWTKPTTGTPKVVEVVCIGGGGGGGNAVQSGALHGSGGGGGGLIRVRFLASLLGSTETVTVGTGGAAQTDGLDTTFGAWLRGGGGKAGGGTTAGGAGGQGMGPGSASTVSSVTGGAGGASSVSDAASVGGDGYAFGAAGGASGGQGIGHGAGALGAQGGSQLSRATPIAGGAAGTINGAGGDAPNCTQYEAIGGAGGGGAGSPNGGGGANGGKGGKYGGGGGGAGGVIGTGGAGANGFCQVITYF